MTDHHAIRTSYKLQIGQPVNATTILFFLCVENLFLRYCSPSRSALMSGRFPIHVNQGNPRCVGTKGGVDLRMEMLPAKLKRMGYRTAIVGKWCVFVIL